MIKYDIAVVGSGLIVLINTKIKHDQYMDDKYQCKSDNKSTIFYPMLIKL